MIPPFRFLIVAAAAHLFCLSSLAQLAPSLLERAATGDATAMLLIGRTASATGKPVEAYAWFSLAAEYGVETAEKPELFNALSPEQVTEATRRIEAIRSTQLRGLPPPAEKTVARVVETKRPVEEEPVALPPVTPAIILPAPDGQVKEQNAQVARLEADLAAARTEVSDARQQSEERTTRLEAALAKAGQEKETLSAEIASLRQDRLRDEEARDEARAELSAVRSKLETDLAAAQTEARVAKQKAGEATRLEAVLAQATQERDALAGEIATLRRDKQRAEELLAQVRAQPSLEGKVQEQNARIAKLEADLVAAQTETRAAKEESGKASVSLDAALAKVGQEKEALSAEIATLRRDKQRAEESLAQLQAKPSLDGQVEAQKARIARLEADLAAARSEASGAREKGGETTQLEAALAKAGQEKEALSEEIATLRQDRLRAEQARDQIRADHSAARSKLESDLAAAQNEARVAKQKAGEATKLEAALAKGTQARDAQVEALNAQIAKLEADLLAARSEVRSGRAQFGESTNQLESALAKATQERDSLSEELATLRGNTSPEIERLRGELAGAEQARTAALALRDAAIRDLTAEQIRNDNLVRELARARPGMPLVSDSTSRAAPSRSLVPEPVAAPAPAAPAPRIHKVAAGENLSIISNRHYGTPNRWAEIFNANRDVMQTQNHLVPGMQLRIP